MKLAETSCPVQAYHSSGGFVPPLIEKNGMTVMDDIVQTGSSSMAYRSRTAKRPRNEVKWEFHLVDMVGIYQSMIDKAYALMEKMCYVIRNPIEVFIIALILSSDKIGRASCRERVLAGV